MPSLRDRLAIENSRSPISSSARSLVDRRRRVDDLAQLVDLLLDLRRPRRRRATSRSRPTRRARRCGTRAAAPAAPAGCRSSSVFGLSAAPPRSSRLDLLPPRRAPGPAVSSAASPVSRAKTCGWRRTSLSAMLFTESAIVKWPASRFELREEHRLEQEVAELLAERRVIVRGRSPRAPRRFPRARTASASRSSARDPTDSRRARAASP